MPILKSLSPAQIEKEHPEVYHSALAHYGLLKNAFASIGVEYAFDEVTDVRRKVQPFLGRLPDTMIAELSGLGVNTVRQLRRANKIPACTRKALLESVVVE